MTDEDFENLRKNMELFPQLREAFLCPQFSDLTNPNIIETNNWMTSSFFICDNSDVVLLEVPNQISIFFPKELRKSKDISVKNFKRDLNKYIKIYEKYSILVNKAINETKECLKNVYNPIKSLHNDIKRNDFENSLNNLINPLEYGKNSLNEINYKNFPKEKKRNFIKEKNDIIKEIDNFLEETNEFYKEYKDLNENILKDNDNYLEKLLKLATSTMNLSNYVRKFIKIFENSVPSLNDLKDIKKKDELFLEINEQINEIYNRSQDIEVLLNDTRRIKIENINEMIEKFNKYKDKIIKFEDSYGKIIEKINTVRAKYDESEEELPDFLNIDAAPIMTTQKEPEENENQGGNFSNC